MLLPHPQRNSAVSWFELEEPNSFKKGDAKGNTKVICFVPYLVCGPELCVCATRIGVTSRLFPLCEKTDFVPAWLILLTVCITQSFCRFVIMSLGSLNLCYIKPNPFCLSNTAQRKINTHFFNTGWVLSSKEGPSKALLFLPVKMPVTPNLTNLMHVIFKDRQSPSSGQKLHVKTFVQESKMSS